ncbi:hypothetical protein [Dapis sp. BLCC M172]|uniref:hypothetical protein n=1 Tax=Dapis sp. BLCC M172 TaxID=2975281 RepID=UPI003CEA0AD7
MIKLEHSFQPLDNKTPNIIEINKQCLDHSVPSDQEKRQKFMSKISRVVQAGKKEQNYLSNIVIYYTNREFLIKTIPKEKDVLNRIAPIISYGEFPEHELEEIDWVDKVVNDIERFASDNHLTFNNKNDLLEKTKLSLTDVWKKKKETFQKIDLICRLFLAVILPLALIYILLHTPQTAQERIPKLIRNWFLEIQILQPVQDKTPPPSVMQIALFISLNNALMISLAKIKVSKLIR